MKPTPTKSRKTAVAVGVLFLLATASYLVGSALIESTVGAPGELANLDKTQVQVGVFLEFINAAVVVGIGVLLFPVLRERREGVALGYAAARIIESALLLVSALFVLLLVQLSEVAAPAGATNYFQSLGALAMEGRDLAFQLAMTVLGAGSLLFCYILYSARLVPRMLSVLGVVGYLSLFASGWLGIVGDMVPSLLYVPGALFEILLPLWLIVKGFNVVDHLENP